MSEQSKRPTSRPATGSFSLSTPDNSLSALELVPRFRQMRVLVIGDAMLDTYLEGTAARLCSEGPVPVVRKTAEYRLPGGAANTAANLRALEAEVYFLGVVGHDIAATLLRAALHERGISDRWLVEDAGAPTLHKLRVLADGQYVVRFDEGGERNGSYSTGTSRRLVANLEAAYEQCDAVLVSDYGYGVTSDALIARLQELHSVDPKVLLIDSKALHRFHGVNATIVTPNSLEAQLLSGHAGEQSDGEWDSERVASSGNSLLSLLATDLVAITLAERGVFLLDRQGGKLHLPAHPIAQANDVGAGDSFASALALALAAGASVKAAAQIALDAASIAVTKRWTAVVQYQELLQRVSLREYASSALDERITPLRDYLAAERAQGRRVVFTNGVFDILHAGHMQFLRQARALGDLLVVGVNSDSSARRLKGAGRPITSERDRLALVAALDVVDSAVLFDEDTPTELIRVLRPTIHVKGGDYANEALPEAEAVREGGGQVVILPLVGSVSTRQIIDRIAALTSADESTLGGKL